MGPKLDDNQVLWVRAPAGLIQKRKYIVGAIGVGLSHRFLPGPADDDSVILTALLDVSDISDLERLLMRPSKSQLTLISPAGEVLLGDDLDAYDLPFGMSFQSDGLHFKLSSGGSDPWVGLYTISYQNFFGYAKWPLLGNCGAGLAVCVDCLAPQPLVSPANHRTCKPRQPVGWLKAKSSIGSCSTMHPLV